MPDNNKPLSTAAWRQRIAASRQVRSVDYSKWVDNVAYRRGQPFKRTPPEDTINVPEDWSRTNNKQAQLFYQVPEVSLKARHPSNAGVAAVYAAALNFQLSHKVKAYHMMNEVMGDVINAAGIGICQIGYEATFETVDLNAQPEMGMTPPDLGIPQTEANTPLMAGSMSASQLPQLPGAAPLGPEAPAPMADPLAAPQLAPRPVYECYFARRISPAQFLRPADFIGSDWQEAPWLGWDGYLPLAEAKRRKWVDDDFEGSQITDNERLLVEDGQIDQTTDSFVKYSMIYAKSTSYDAEEKDTRKLKRIVLVDGLEGDKAKVVDEDFQWQRYVEETRSWIGMTTFPIKVLTLTTISDMAIPPSDSEISRPQVRELIRGRSTVSKQRETSLPLRWYDINQIDPAIADRLRKGKWQDMIPMNGPGAQAIGEVARANYPREAFEFDRIAKADLDAAWSMGAPQMSTPTEGETTATEVKAMQSSLNVRLDFERAKVLRFFLEVAEGIGALMQLFSDREDWVEIVGEDGAKTLEAWNKDVIRGDYLFEAKPDSAIKLDVSQQRAESLNLYKLLRRDPLINPQALVMEVLELHGLDPSKIIAPAKPPEAPPDKRTFSFKGEDLINPIAVAIIQQGPKPLTPNDIAAAKKLIEDAAAIPMPPVGMGGGAEVDGMEEGGAEGGGPPTGDNPQHPGPPAPVNPVNRRYEQNESQGAEGSRDSGVPTP